MKLGELLAKVSGLGEVPAHPALDLEIRNLSTNSHSCQAGDLFIGMPGTRVDGGEFWPSAVAAGAIAAIASESALTKHPLGKNCVISSTDIAKDCAEIAAVFYNYPAQTLKLVGVTGTNGKTTTTHLIESFLTQGQKPTALLGTLYAKWPGYHQTAINTTPFAVTLQAQLSQAVGAGCEYGVMEVSSHSLEQKRVWGCPFEVSVFTNLTQDHLDYHPTMEAYFEAKALLFSPDYLKGKAIINFDDPYGKRLIERLPQEQVWSYSTENRSASLWTSDLEYQPKGVKGILHTLLGEIAFESPLVGQFNVSNLLAAIGAGLHLGITLETMVSSLPDFLGVPGRMERVSINRDQEITVIVDYAHTPDSLENLLKASRPFIPGRMICVFGCGGDRDRTKRPIMGKIAAELSDVPVVTSDNPRTENPEQILQDIVAGIPESAQPMVIGDRAEAIRHAILDAKPGDGILIAGKGHEDYQILGTEKIHFDDREQARLALGERA
ncbi:UDP-N-acetylmuramoyl-L-alanyl-D-glutamate--2,6-diaminopimelate ligase [Roseofilum reptotaenium CS-1145]|uniref:UDP-N-acetylmuramoyl-L-alanyl-D-glutamate--2,6-diaminopimelate ligase n=1 Tax=Roseofilum reptotaenium AO1-A TaxID=1925591 RepID=A0A1L9QUP5_9CYAN|nr:UDP-N-acetylmuramoyl-L-alanyl-D-glutamate--2,6-diaminopimelate ligase [Roseofilum reptotaenium]MDB9516389.1 UDP-N-acetylmuramoyl-L-alanyl-D-glutamate--2,6-diaminopimelate ligase [Roseofilum reptotaenium CS-1145]OJJ26410.1 UDP-N-acetylmuramoyl-L-alanyl-D-glutamate--2,6-diaminopimelate ligase [Roseofilum reptotaenium AO1-A]